MDWRRSWRRSRTSISRNKSNKASRTGDAGGPFCLHPPLAEIARNGAPPVYLNFVLAHFQEAVVNVKHLHLRACLILCSFVVMLQPLQGTAQQNSDASRTRVQQTAAERDGQHDFDPLIGAWKYHLKKLVNPLTGSTTWTEFDGTGVCYKIWDGRAQLDTIEVDSPTGHIEGLTLRTYNPQSHQWRLYWANSKTGIIDPPQIGEFKNGRGEFTPRTY